MTGYGQGKAELGKRELIAEIKTLNHRYLDINIRTARSLSFIEDEIRALVQKHLSRGRVEVYIEYNNGDNTDLEVSVNRPLLSAYLNGFKELEEQFNIKNDLSLSTLMTLPDIFTIKKKNEDDDVVKQLASQATEMALCTLKVMRQKEGNKLMEDILRCTNEIHHLLQQIRQRAPLVVEEYRTKLKEKIRELIESTELDENRFNTEVAYFADRSNITEEIVRLASHLEQIKAAFNVNDPIGRKLDFLMQEMNREANTIGSKTGDLVIIRLVLDIKSGIEKIREQVQNIE